MTWLNIDTHFASRYLICASK
ncbi:hypothetical protein XBFFL1_2490047 [Xenorhabdus bovienii str. feltiae Florida]|uniref:Uncharacterized protein n=2 Tax=Xenorhabdus bovienii TaxID=40576 RepID=A0A077PTV9_XENBV|nr:hypothetical protein XBFFR1_560047 [Xenorhabdus bovienii str. feltiae France]CDG93327.1 hypothetical protein XBFFL1_2490047 [Xenorhabdus bovienii str. feltiae Florida]CDH02079.1 hypothetical protein XBFM1_2480012 [Xenorhabdus bovienii str. feltiae Moldova]CDH24062.1 hypothetical protein XBKB1_2370002 [Xenorhabdus bovienii str. kraussei Becker Underwood]